MCARARATSVALGLRPQPVDHDRAPSHSVDLAPAGWPGSRLLACYRVRNDGKLKYLRRVPVALKKEW